MAKFYGPVGYGLSMEIPPGSGNWNDVITEYSYYGDVIKNMVRTKEGDQVNDNLAVDNRISIVADEFAYNNIQGIRYVMWMGALWKVTSVEIQRPRLILNIGGLYNGPRPERPRV